MQIHEIIRLEDPDRFFARAAAWKPLLRRSRREDPLHRLHWAQRPLVHLRMLEVAAEHKCRFDAVQMPLNVLDAHFRSFEQKVLPLLVKEEIGVLV